MCGLINNKWVVDGSLSLLQRSRISQRTCGSFRGGGDGELMDYFGFGKNQSAEERKSKSREK
jgi:hypothetical protein